MPLSKTKSFFDSDVTCFYAPFTPSKHGRLIGRKLDYGFVGAKRKTSISPSLSPQRYPTS